MNKKLSFFLLLIGFYLLSTGVSFAVFKFAKGKTPVLESPLPAGDLGQGSHFPVLTGPKDQTCPLNGAMFTKTEKDLWSARRPMAVMIENHTDSRPQSGLSKADVVYEAVAEGAITRFLAIFIALMPPMRLKMTMTWVRFVLPELII